LSEYQPSNHAKSLKKEVIILVFENFLKNLPDEVPTFESFRIRDKNPLGGADKIRFLQRQNPAMKIIHQRLFRYLRGLYVPLPFSTAFRRRNSPKKNLERHRKNRYFYIVDLKSAFSSVDRDKLSNILCGLDQKLNGCSEEVLAFLEKYCFSPNKGLVTGDSSSPDIFNIYADELLDKPLANLCQRYELTYTRYCDDLTFSSHAASVGGRKRKAIRQVIEAAGFKVNHRKSAVYDLQKGPVVINGIGLELGGRIFLPRHYLRKIKGMLHKAEDGKVNSAKVHGRMGTFWGATSQYALNKTEKKLVNSYRAFCARQA